MQDTSEVCGKGWSTDFQFEEFRRRSQQFATDRDWDKFHTPRNLVLALVGEVGELAELFQWHDDALGPFDFANFSDAKCKRVAEELADRCGIDLGTAINAKMKRNAEKYPADLVRGSSKKYCEYPQWNGEYNQIDLPTTTDTEVNDAKSGESHILRRRRGSHVEGFADFYGKDKEHPTGEAKTFAIDPSTSCMSTSDLNLPRLSSVAAAVASERCKEVGHREQHQQIHKAVVDGVGRSSLQRKNKQTDAEFADLHTRSKEKLKKLAEASTVLAFISCFFLLLYLLIGGGIRGRS